MVPRYFGPVLPREGMRAGFYDIVVAPGNRNVRKKSDQGSQRPTGRVRFANRNVVCEICRYQQVGTCADDAATGGSGFEFLFAALPATVEYYVESNGVRSKTYTLTAIELPGIKKLRVTYRLSRSGRE